jgi:hypothetical protein
MLEFPDNYYIIPPLLLPCITRSQELFPSFQILRPVGCIIVAAVTAYVMYFRSTLAIGIRYRQKFRILPKENRIVSPDDVAQFLEAAGFQVEESRLIQKESNVVCVSGRKKT